MSKRINDTIISSLDELFVDPPTAAQMPEWNTRVQQSDSNLERADAAAIAKIHHEIEHLNDGYYRKKREEKEADRRAEADDEAKLLRELERRQYNHHAPPVKPLPIVSLGGQTICTPGNLSAVTAKAKEGKTAVLSGLIAAALNPLAPESRLLGFQSCRNVGGAIIHIDTEQSRYDHHKMVLRTLRRAGLEEPPPKLKSYCLADVDVSKRMQMLKKVLEREGKVFILVIDGVADLLLDPNDGPASFALVGELHKLAITHDCPVVLVLHENPGSESGKTRGHLGSHLERKAETNLRLSKVDGVTTMWIERGRHCSIPKEQGIRFHFSEGQQMHVLAPPLSEVKMNAAKQSLLPFAMSVYEGVEGGLTWTQLKEKVAQTGDLTPSGARKKMERLEKLGLISWSPGQGYTLFENE